MGDTIQHAGESWVRLGWYEQRGHELAKAEDRIEQLEHELAEAELRARQWFDGRRWVTLDSADEVRARREAAGRRIRARSVLSDAALTLPLALVLFPFIAALVALCVLVELMTDSRKLVRWNGKRSARLFACFIIDYPSLWRQPHRESALVQCADAAPATRDHLYTARRCRRVADDGESNWRLLRAAAIAIEELAMSTAVSSPSESETRG